jgi:hypothetical protein
VVAHDVGWSSERPPGWCTAGAELRHGVVTGVVTDGDREREERIRCSADRERERERRGLKQVRRHSGDFFCAGVLFKISSACWRVFQIFFCSGWLCQPIQKNISLFFVVADYVSRYEK